MKKKVQEIVKHELFHGLFPIHDEIKGRIKQDMSQNGFDENQPVVLAKWQGQEEAVCVDGYTRLSVADELGIDEAPTVTYELATEQDAFEMALKRQSHRRSLTDAEVYQCIEIMTTRYGNPPNGGPTYKVQEIADKLGLSKRKTERAIRVVENATPETKIQIKSGITSINGAERSMKVMSNDGRPHDKKPKKKRSDSRMVEIEPDHWERMQELVGQIGGTIEDIVDEALEMYFSHHSEEEDEVENETEEEAEGDYVEPDYEDYEDADESEEEAEDE